MAIHKTVFYSPDRQWRITADPGGKKFRVEHEGQFVMDFSSLPDLEAFLATFHIAVADLVED